MAPKRITTDADYQAALERIAELGGVPLGSPAADELDDLLAATEAYEDERDRLRRNGHRGEG